MKNGIKVVGTALLAVWFSLVSLASPLWLGWIYMDITGHGKGYGYDMGSEADIAVFFGIALLILWLLNLLPAAVLLYKKARRRKKAFGWLLPAAFAVLFAAGVWILGWSGFIGMFGPG